MHPETCSFGLRSNVIISVQASLSAEFKRTKFPGTRWVCEMQYNACSEEDLGEREAFFAELEGQSNDVMMWHPKRPLPLGTFRSTSALASTSQNPKQLTISNAPPNATLLRGDMIGSNGQIFMVTQPVQISSIGIGIVRVSPGARSEFVNSPLIVDRPSTRFVISEPQVLVPSAGRNGLEFAVTFVEIFNA